MARKWTDAEKQAARERALAHRAAKAAQAEPEETVGQGWSLAADAAPDHGGGTSNEEVGRTDPLDRFEEAEDLGIDGPDEADARRARLLEGIDPDIAALISDAELDKIEAEEQQKAEAERKKQALATVRDQFRQRARVEHDLIAADVLRSDAEKKRLAEKVKFRVSLPNEGAGHSGRNGFRVDGRLFQAGFTYTETRAVFESLQANHYRAWLAEVAFKTLDQQKPGQSAREIIGQLIPQFEVAA